MSAAKSIVFFWLLCTGAFASDAFLVVPNANATTPGVGEAIPQITNTNIRDQEIIGSDQFGSGAILINQIGYRALPGSGPVTATISVLKVSLSTSPHSPNSSNGNSVMSEAYATNLGPDNTVVYSGPGLLNSPGCAGPSPCPFDQIITFSTPFLYNPALGSLLIDLQYTGFTATSTGSLDSAAFPFPPGGSVAHVDGFLSQSTGTFAAQGHVLQIGYTVPSSVLTFTGSGSGDVSSLSLTGSGTLTPFGAASVALTGGEGQGGLRLSFAFTFADGDTLTASGPANNSADQSFGLATVTGGTGAFLNATGSFNFLTEAPFGATSNNVSFTLNGYGSIVTQGSLGCTFSISPGGEAFPSAGGSGSISVTAPAGCIWDTSGTPSWVTFTTANGTGSGTASYTVAPNAGADMSDTLSVAGQPFTIEEQGTVSGTLSSIGSMAHLAAEENWTTTFTLVNKSAAATIARLSFFGDVIDPSGNGPLMLPLVFPQQGAAAGPLLAASFDQALAANASLIVTTGGPQTPPVLVGSAQLTATGAVNGFAIFHQIPTAQEAVVPLETRNAPSYLLAFDNTTNLVLGVAAENLSAQTAVIPVIIRDDTGVVISSPGASISLGGNGHTSFVLSDPTAGFPVTANKRGTIEFDTPAGGQISVLGLRFTPPNNALTTIPALANVGTGGGSIAHLASGGDGWQTTFVLVNTGTTSTSVTLSFFDDQTGLPVSLPLAFPQTGGATTMTVPAYTAQLAAGATLLIVSAGVQTLITGSAQLATTGHVSGFVIFRHNGQEAVVPLESRNASGYIIAFDNTNGTATGIAVNAVSTQSVNIPVIVRDDTGAQLANDTITLAANGHYAFTLGTDRYPAALAIRGTIEFDKPANAQIGALGIRIPNVAAHTYTTLPALAK